MLLLSLHDCLSVAVFVVAAAIRVDIVAVLLCSCGVCAVVAAMALLFLFFGALQALAAAV